MLRNTISQASGAVPVALAVWKRARWCTVAKITILDDEPVLAIAHRAQHGVTSTISIPVSVLAYAEQRGCAWFYFRRDTTGEMWRLPIVDVRKQGWLAASDGVAEVFVPIAKMRPVLWRRWPYAERVIQISNEQRDRPAVRQLALW